jgi:hypothetical protein
MIIEEFYTYEFEAEDLIIRKWNFQEKNDDGLLVYYNEATDLITECVEYDTEEEFAKENDVFLTQWDALLENTEFIPFDDVWGEDE